MEEALKMIAQEAASLIRDEMGIAPNDPAYKAIGDDEALWRDVHNNTFRIKVSVTLEGR